jgi:uncharacterized protein YyaL (SSP411 family)
VDAFWMVPHFEKMLYDQAQLVRAYLHGWQVTGKPEWLQVVTETIAYVLRDLRHAGGGFYSAEDADSEGEEGRFYIWRIEELRDVAGDAAIEWYGATGSGNFEGRNILHRPVRGNLVRPADVEAARQRLFDVRERRVRPGLDDKVLTEWNALFVSALAEAGAATGNTEWVDAAERCAEFLVASLRRDGDGRWLRSWQADGGARHLAFGADHAALVDVCSRPATMPSSSSPGPRTCSTTPRRRRTRSPASRCCASPRSRVATTTAAARRTSSACSPSRCRGTRPRSRTFSAPSTS